MEDSRIKRDTNFHWGANLLSRTAELDDFLWPLCTGVEVKRGKKIKTFVIFWIGGALFYWWLVTKLQGQQLGAAVIIGGLVSAGLVFVKKEAELSFKFEPRWFGLLLKRLPTKIVHDIALLGVVLSRALFRPNYATGAYRTVKFNPDGSDEKSAGRRALVFAGVSLPPNSFAVSIEGGDSFLIHQLMSEPEPTDEQWPI